MKVKLSDPNKKHFHGVKTITLCISLLGELYNKYYMYIVYMIPSKREVVACFGAIPDGAATPVVVRCIPIGPVLKRCSSRIIKR